MVINLPTDTKQLILTEDNDVLTITLNIVFGVRILGISNLYDHDIGISNLPNR